MSGSQGLNQLSSGNRAANFNATTTIYQYVGPGAALSGSSTSEPESAGSAVLPVRGGMADPRVVQVGTGTQSELCAVVLCIAIRVTVTGCRAPA
eukprot:1773392-Rhodomonas_salina.1